MSIQDPATCPLSEFQRDASVLLRRLKETGSPVELTIDGKAEVVVQDSDSYRRLVDRADRAEERERLRASVEDMRAGRTVPAEGVVAEIRQILADARRP